MRKASLIVLFCLNCYWLFGQDSIPSKTAADSAKVISLDEVVVSASKVSEKIIQSPVSIEKAGARYFRASPAPSFFDALENIKGVHMITPSLGFKVINTRGFANTTNVRFAQLVDGMDVQAPHIGAPIGNSLGPSDLDIDNVEIVPGSVSALYGMNTINGMANFSTKNPFANPGISIQQKIGVNHFNDPNSDAKVFSETSLRIAKVLSPKFAFKLNGVFSKGYDWIADDHTDLNPNANISTGLTGADNPAIDPVNGYGNESANRRTLTLGGKNYVVARTGYFEKEVADYNLQNIKADAALHYKISNNTTIIYTYRFAQLNTIYQRSNRFTLENYIVQQHGLEIKSRSIQFRTYLNLENTGRSYNLRSMAENIDRDFKKDDPWFSDYTKGYNNAVQAGATVADAHRAGRAFADDGRLVPGTPEFDEALGRLQDVNNWDMGAALRVKAGMFHAEGQINITDQFFPTAKKNIGLEVLAGFDHRTYIIQPDGNYFINPEKGNEYSNLTYGKTGGFVSATKTLFHEKLKLGATIRADKNDYFDLKWNPRFTAVFLPNNKSSIRFSFQSGYRFPSIFEAFSNVNSGGVKRVGGLPVMSSGIFENSYLRVSIDAFRAAVNKDVNTGGLTKAQAIEKNEGVLKKNTYTYLEPEKINSFETGYKTALFDAKLFVDVDFYYNKYENFIAQVEVNIPKTSKPDSIAYYLYDNKLQDRYRMWTNSKSTVYNYGGTFGLTWKFYKNYLIYANVSMAKLDKKTTNDGLEDGFNTPQWITNLSISNENIYKNLGFGITGKWQSSFYWQSFLINGTVPSFYTIDCKVNYSFPRFPLILKVGATNLINKYYYSFLGGPAIGGFYYTSFAFNLNK